MVVHRAAMCGCILALSGSGAVAADIDFSHQIVPILKEHCAKCHTGAKKKGGLSMDTREALLAGGENGKVVEPGKSASSKLLRLIASTDENEYMPPEGPRVPAEQVALLKAWIDGGLIWEKGFSFSKPAYEPPLKPRRPDLPPVVGGRTNPVDRILDAYLKEHRTKRPEAVGDEVFLRRAYLDIVGLLPTPEQRAAFLADSSPGKRAELVRALLGRPTDYAEHWLTFWNDLLRNDYAGTGYIDGGRKQITKWLYSALVNNMPFDQFARELIAPPSSESEGFAAGIKWRGSVSAGQQVAVQFSQSVSQTFLGINMKCASCHDSFVDRWKLDEAYGLAAVYATEPLDIARCDKPTGRKAVAAWLFPELGQIDAAAPQKKRLEQLAGLMTHPENGRFTRTIVNRIWQRLMGRGIVHPADAMQTPPWNADLLDYLAAHLQDNGYDLKKTIELIATSHAYQSAAEKVVADEAHGYVYAGPRARRMTAEQFVDAIRQLSGTAPQKFDAPVVRGRANPMAASGVNLSGAWIWSDDTPAGQSPAGDRSIALRKTFTLAAAPKSAPCVVSCDNEYRLFVNGRKLGADEDWQTVETYEMGPALRKGENEILLIARNAGGLAANPAAAFLEVHAVGPDGGTHVIATDGSWQWSPSLPDAKGKFAKAPDDWKAAAIMGGPWMEQLTDAFKAGLASGEAAAGLMVRASLLKNNALMRSLGRPGREQIVSVRPNDLTTLEALDLENAQSLFDDLAGGAKRLVAACGGKPDELARQVFVAALCREPNRKERGAAVEGLSSPPTEKEAQDLLWAVCMLPEFQLIR